MSSNDSKNIKHALNSPSLSHPNSASRKSDKEVLANKLPGKTPINKYQIRIYKYHIPKRLYQQTNKCLYEMLLRLFYTLIYLFLLKLLQKLRKWSRNAKGNLVKLLRSKLVGEAT